MKNNIRINVIVNIIRTLVLTVLSFITYPWVCRYLGDSALGTYSWAVTFVGYFLVLAKIGIPNLAIRECVKVRDNKELLSNKVQLFFIIQGIATVLSFALMCILVVSIPQLKSNSSLIFILSLNFLVGAFSFEWVFIALEKQFYMSARMVITLTLTAILVITMVSNPDDIYIYALITVSVTILSVISNLFYIRKFVTFRKTMPYEIKGLFKPLFTLAVLSLFITAYNQTDTFVLGFIDQSKTEVGSYSVGVKSIDIIIGFITALSTVFIPQSTHYWQFEDKTYFNRITKYSVNIALFITLPAVATITVLATPITKLISGNYINEGFTNSQIILMTLSSIMITYSISDIIYNQILLPQGKEKKYLYALIAGTLLNLALSLIFGLVIFKDKPSVGVALGTAIVDLIIMIYLVIDSFEWVKKAIFNLNSLKIFISAIVIAATSIGLLYGFKNAFIHMSEAYQLSLTLVFTILIDTILYIAILLITKEDLVSSFIKRKTKREAKI